MSESKGETRDPTTARRAVDSKSTLRFKRSQLDTPQSNLFRSLPVTTWVPVGHSTSYGPVPGSGGGIPVPRRSVWRYRVRRRPFTTTTYPPAGLSPTRDSWDKNGIHFGKDPYRVYSRVPSVPLMSRPTATPPVLSDPPVSPTFWSSSSGWRV